MVCRAHPLQSLWAGGITVFHQGSDNDGQLWYTYSADGTNWGHRYASSGPIYVGLTLGGRLQRRSLCLLPGGEPDTPDSFGTPLTTAQTGAKDIIPNLGMSGSPSAALWAGGITVFHQGSGNDGQLWYTYSPDGTNWGGRYASSERRYVGLTLGSSILTT